MGYTFFVVVALPLFVDSEVKVEMFRARTWYEEIG